MSGCGRNRKPRRAAPFTPRPSKGTRTVNNIIYIVGLVVVVVVVAVLSFFGLR